MAIKASASVTLSVVIDVKATYRYYLLQSSTLTAPTKPTVYPPSSSWTDTEPTYTDGSTNSLYFVDCTVFCDDTFSYSEVSLSSSYEAAKVAYNKAVNAQNTANSNAETIKYHTEVLSEHSAKITQNETEIQLRVESTEFESYQATVDGELVNLGSRMETAESDISVMQDSISLKVEQTDIDTAIAGIEIGGRNLAIGTTDEWTDVTVAMWSGYLTHSVNGVTSQSHHYSDYGVEPGDYLTFSADLNAVGKRITLRVDTTDGSATNANFSEYVEVGESGHCELTIQIDEAYPTINVYIGSDGSVSDYTTEQYKCFKVEKGNKATDWTPAPEDYSTTTETEALIELTKDSILSSVSSTYTTINETNQLATRLDSAELLLTKDSLVATIGSYYTTQSDVDSSIDAIEIGGRNLLTKTNQGTTSWGYATENGTVSIEEYICDDGVSAAKLECISSSEGWAFAFYRLTDTLPKLLPNTEYTLSFDLLTDNSSSLTIYIVHTNGTNYLTNNVKIDSIETGTWQKVAIKLTTNDMETVSSQVLYINGMNTVGYRIFKNLKLEKGNKATDWTPAPEDTEAAITEVKTIATQTSTMFNWLVQGSADDITSLTLTDKMTELITDTLVIKDSTGSSTIISGGTMNIDAIFAQDITATGTITGVNLVGATGEFSGSIESTEGVIGGWNIFSTCLYNDYVSTDGNVYTTLLQNITDTIYLTDIVDLCAELTQSTSEFDYAVQVKPTDTCIYIDVLYTFSVSIPTDNLIHGKQYTIYIYDGYNKKEETLALYNILNDSTDSSGEDDSGDSSGIIESLDPTIEYDAPGDTGSTTAKLNKYITFTYDSNCENYRLEVALRDMTADSSYDFIFAMTGDTDNYDNIVISDGLDLSTILGVKCEDTDGNIITPLYILRDGTIYTENQIIMANSSGEFWSVTVDDSNDLVYLYNGTETLFRMRSDGSFYAAGSVYANDGYLVSTANGNTVTIGSQEANYCHIYNSQSWAFLFSNSVYTKATFRIADTTTYLSADGLTINNGKAVIGSDTESGYLRLTTGTDLTWELDGPGSELRLHHSGSVKYYFCSDGNFKATGELISTAANALRAVYGNYGVMLRNDGSNFYFLITASGDQYGSWNSLRPIHFSLSTGLVTLGNGLSTTSIVVVHSDTTESSVKVANSYRTTNFCVGSTGNTGLWDTTNSNWIIQSGTDQTVYIPHPLSISTRLYIGSTTYNNGYIELYGGSPFIDFHFNNSTADYTSRIIEESSGTLRLTSHLRFGITGSSDYRSAYIQNSVHSGGLHVAASGNLGLFSDTNQNWIFYANSALSIGYSPATSLVIGNSSSGVFRPATTNVMSCGHKSYLWTQVYAKTTSISSSDRNVKKDFRTFDSNENYEKFFMDLKPTIFKYIDGESGRDHFGYISQDVEESLYKYGFDDKSFAGFCKDVRVDLVVDDNGHEVEVPILDENGKEQYDYALRYSEFISLNTYMIQKAYGKLDTYENRLVSIEDQLEQARELIEELQYKVSLLEALV